MATPNLYSSTVSIEELLNGNTRRLVVLAGAGLPFQGVPWGGELVMQTTNYPGNSAEATQSIFGPKEAPTAMQGEWARTLLAESGTFFMDENGGRSFITSPALLRDALESIFRGGLRLRVVWSVSGTAPDQNGNMVREGRAKSWNFAHDRLQDIKWNVEFHWASRGEKQAPVSNREDNVVVASNNLTGAIDAAIAKYKAQNARRTLPSTFSLGQLEALAGAPNAMMQGITRSLTRTLNQFGQLGSVIGKLRSQPYAIANTAVNFAANTAAIANRFVDNVGRMPPEQMVLKSRVTDVLRTYKSMGELVDAAALVARRAMEMDAQLRQVIATARQTASRVSEGAVPNDADVLGVHVTKPGDTPERLSMKWYGNPDRGVDILRANRLPWHQSVFRPGVPLVIPRLRAATTNAV